MFVFTHCFVVFDANFHKIRTKYGQNTKNYERIRAITNEIARRVRKIEMRDLKTGTWRNTIWSKQLLSDMLERNQPKPNRQLFWYPRSNQEPNHVIFQDIVWELLLKLVCKGM